MITISILFSLMVAVVIGGFYALIGLVTFIGSILAAFWSKCDKPKIEDNIIDTTATIVEKPKHNYRYILINIMTGQAIGAGDDYLEICKAKRALGNGIMIKDTQYVKKKRIL